MFGEQRSSSTQEIPPRLKAIALGVATFIGLGFANEVHAEEAPVSPGTVETLDAAPEHRAHGAEELTQQAEGCKRVYEDIKRLHEKAPLWPAVDTVLGGKDGKEIGLAQDGLQAVGQCFGGDSSVVQIFRQSQGGESGATIRVIDGSPLERAVAAVKDLDTQALAKVTGIFDATNDDPTINKLRQAAATGQIGLSNIDSVSVGVQFATATDGGHHLVYSGTVGVGFDDGHSVVAQAQAGLDSPYSLVDGGHTTVGVSAELSSGNHHLDLGAGAYLVTSLGSHRPDLVLNATGVAGGGKGLTVTPSMALRFDKTLWEKS